MDWIDSPGIPNQFILFKAPPAGSCLLEGDLQNPRPTEAKGHLVLRSHHVESDGKSGSLTPSIWWWILFWLVGQGHPSEKYDFVNWDDEIPNIWENKIDVQTKPPTSIWLPAFFPFNQCIDGMLNFFYTPASMRALYVNVNVNVHRKVEAGVGGAGGCI